MATAIQGQPVGRVTRPQPLAERLAPLTGLAVLPLGLGGLIVWEGPANRPEWDAPGRVILDYFRDRNTVVLGGFLIALSVCFFLWFAGSLRAILARGEGGEHRLSTTAFGAALVTAAAMLAMPATNVVGAVYSDRMSSPMAQTFFLMGNVFIYAATFAASVAIAAAGLAILRARVLPLWLGWVSLAFALWLLIPPLGSTAGTPENPAIWTGLGVMAGIPIWTAITALALARAAAAPPPRESVGA